MIKRYTAFLLIGLFPCVLLAQSEQEPNDDTATANALTLGAPINGAWCSGDGADVFSFTTSADGYLQMGFDVSHADAQVNVTLDVRLLDANGADVDGQITTSGPGGVVQENPFTLWCLAQGTYYLQVSGSANNECNDYSLTAALVQPPFGNDNEPNNSSAQAQVLTDGVYAQGHVNYSYGGDLTDWFRFELPGDGRVDLDLDAFNQNSGSFGCTLELLDGSMTSVATHPCFVGAIFSPDTAFNPFTHFCLAQGTYYLHVTDVQLCGMSYRIRWSFTAPAFENDNEPDNSSGQALVLTNDVYAEGHLSYAYNGGDDTDWFRFDTPSDGMVALDFDAFNQNAGTFGTTMELLDGSLNNINTYNAVVGAIFSPDTSFNPYTRTCLQQGTYYVHLGNTQLCGVSYRLRYSFTPAALAVDAEPNNALAQAIPVLDGEEHEGHIDFGPGDDNTDWYVFPMPSGGDPNLALEAAHQVNGSYPGTFTLYDQSGTSISTTPIAINPYSTFDVTNFPLGTLAAGTYYIEFNSGICGASYRFTLSGVGQVGIEGSDATVQVTATPNPSVEGLFRLSTGSLNPARVQVFDAQGRMVYERHRISPNGLVLDLSQEPAGIYSVKLTDAKGVTVSTRIVRAF